MKRLILLFGLIALAGCSSPRETCLKAATRDLAVVDALILQTRGNLERGYAVDQEPYVTNQVGLCVGNGGYAYGRGGVGFNYCMAPTTRYRNQPVAIDRVTEQRKLTELMQTRARLLRETEQRVEQCNRLHPAG